MLYIPIGNCSINKILQNTTQTHTTTGYETNHKYPDLAFTFILLEYYTSNLALYSFYLIFTFSNEQQHTTKNN